MSGKPRFPGDSAAHGPLATRQKRNQVLEWTPEDLHKPLLDVVQTTHNKLLSEAKQEAVEKMLQHKSDSFKNDYRQRTALSRPETLEVYRSAAEILADDVAAIVEDRKAVTVVVCGPEKPEKAEATKVIVKCCLDALKDTLDAAARQHEAKLERIRDSDARAAEAAQAEGGSEQGAGLTPDECGGSESPAKAAGNAVAAARSIASPDPCRKRPAKTPSFAAVSEPLALPRSPAVGKRVSLLKRQSIVADQALKFLPPPVLTKGLLPPDDASSGGNVNTNTTAAVVAQGVRLPPLSPGSPVVSPVSASGKTSAGGAGEDGRKKSAGARLPSLGVTSLSGNGRKGTVSCLDFDGRGTSVRVPTLPGLNSWIHKSEIEFWLKTDERNLPMTVLHISDKQSSPAALCISLNVNERFEYEEGTTLFFLRDSECSCLITTSQEDFFTDRWLHLVFVIRDAPGNSVHLKVDGRESRLSIRAAEGPKVFDKWDPYLVLGGEVQTHTAGEAEPSKLEKLFSGRLADVKLWSVPSAADASLKFHWNLSEDPQDPSAAPDSVGKAPGAISGPGWLPVSFPDTSLYFNGVKTFVNLSPLGDFGQKLAGGFRFEFWVRVTNSSAAMSVLKTTDTAQKRMVIGFDLNTNALSQHQKGCTLLTVRDAAGSELVAFQSAVDLCDQKWHRIEWEVSPPQDTMSLRVDGFSVNLDYHKCEAPSVFVSFSQFLCLGGYNNRGAVQNPFQGFIRDVKVASCKPKDAYAPVAYWKLDEGAGACLAMDSTGNGNNGVVYDRGPRKKCATWLAVDLPDALKPENAVGFLADSICTPTGRLFPYEDNAVSVSALRTAMVADECGIHREVVLDVAGGGSGGKKVALAPVELAAYGERRGGEMVVLSEVPPDAFHPAKGYADAAALAGCGEGGVEAPGTTAVTVMLGAGRLTVVSLIGHNRRSRDVWDPALAEWQAPVALISADDKISLSSNRAAAASSKLLMHLGTSPALFRRAHRRFAPSDEGGAAVDVIKHGCFSVEESYFVLVRVADPAAQTPCEANYARWFVDGVAAATRGHAAVVVQKQVRRLLAAARAAKVRAERSETERRRLLREATRLEQPQLACVRDERVAFFVDGLGSTHPPDSSRARAGASREGNGCKQAEGAAPAQNPAAQSAPASLPGAAKPAPATATTLHPETSGNGSGGGGGGGKALGPHAHAASVARQAVALAVAMRAEGWQIEHLACETPAAILASVAAAQAAAAGGKVVFYCFTGFAGFETPYGVSRTREELHSLVAADEGKHRVLLEKDEQREFGGLVAGDEAEREEAERERAAREMEDKELQKEMRRKELDARLDARRKGSNRWVTSTKVVDPKGSRPGGKGGPSGRSATDEELSLAEQKTPLPFSPSATPALADLPPEEAWDPAPRTYLCPAAPPLVPNPRNTADFAAVTAALRAPAGTLGHHFIAAVQCLGAPNTGSDGFAYLSYSNGDEVMWGGEESAQFLGVYLARLFTGRGTVSTAKLLRYPPRDGNKPGAERGVSWDSFYDYISARMGKRGCRVVRSDRPDTYIGDLILADRSVKRPSFAGNAARKRATAAMHGGVVTFLLRPDSASYAPQRAYLAEKLAHLLNSDRFSAQVEAAPPPPETEHTLLLAFAGAISDASPPLTPRADWEAYLDRLSGKIKKSKFTYALHPGPTPTAFTVSVTFSDPEPVSRIVAAVLGSVDVSLQPSGLPLPPFVPTGCSVPQSLDFIAPIASLQRLQKASISGQLAAVLSLVPGVAFVDFRQATDGELAAMDERSRHVKSIKKKEADARKNNLSPNDQRRKDIEEKRRSLRGSV